MKKKEWTLNSIKEIKYEKSEYKKYHYCSKHHNSRSMFYLFLQLFFLCIHSIRIYSAFRMVSRRIKWICSGEHITNADMTICSNNFLLSLKRQCFYQMFDIPKRWVFFFKNIFTFHFNHFLLLEWKFLIWFYKEYLDHEVRTKNIYLKKSMIHLLDERKTPSFCLYLPF